MSLTRRNVLAAAAGAPLLSAARSVGSMKVRSIHKPRALAPGDTVAAVTPASAIDAAELADLQKNLQGLGFRVKVGAHASDYWGYLGGTDEHRAQDLNAAFADPEVQGIVCIQGGYGTGRLLDLLDYDVIRRNPKVVIGYSDITGLLMGIHAKTGNVVFHGPIGLDTFQGYEGELFKRVVETAEPAGLFADPTDPTGHAPDPGPATLVPGQARGRLVGGNLTLVSSLAGSPYLPSFSGHIVFLEDIGEEPYRIDRMLNTLRISGAMRGVNGLVFGDFSARQEKPFAKAQDPARTFTMQQVLQNFADQMKVPAYCGAWFGHIRDKYTLPIGIEAEIDADRRALTIVEAAVTPSASPDLRKATG